MLRLTIARANLYLGERWLKCMNKHLEKRMDYLSVAKAMDGYTPALMYKDCYHKIWCYLGLNMAHFHELVIDKIMPTTTE